MSEIRHHVPESLLAAYVSGALDHAFSLVVASHASLCAECAARLGAHEALGGAVLEALPSEEVSPRLKALVLEALDRAVEPAPVYRPDGPLPAPVTQALGGEAPNWRSLGFGARQCVLVASETSSARLLRIPPGHAVPEHGHNGLELTLVLQGRFHDARGDFGLGDLDVADNALDHTPIAGGDQPCICLAATDAPLRFKGFLPRLLQPIMGI